MMTMQYETTALAVANYFIDAYQQRKESERGYPIDLLRLNKLVYISYGIIYGYLRKRLYADRIEAWRYGPVIPSVYHTFKHKGRSPITEPVKVPDEVCRLDENSAMESWLDGIMDIYSNESGVDLIERTHACGSPWWRALRGREGEKNVEIKKGVIEDHYSELKKIRESRKS